MTTRVPIDEMEPLERLAHEVGVEVHGLKCDTEGCTWSDMTIPLDAYASHLTKRCPECEALVLTGRDFAMVMSMVFGAAAIAYRDKTK